MQKKFAEFSTLCSATKVVVCSLPNKRVTIFTIVPYCQQIAEHSAPAVPQSIRGRIPHSILRIPQSIFTPKTYLLPLPQEGVQLLLVVDKLETTAR